MKTSSRLIVTGVVAAVTVALVIAAARAPRLSEFEPTPDDAFVIDGFAQDVTVTVDGRLEVVESIDVTFREERRGIFRDLDTVGMTAPVTYEVLGVDRGTPDQPWDYTVEDNGSRQQVKIGNADIVLEPGPQHYRIAYLMDGLLFRPSARPDMVQVRIDVPGAEWQTTVAETRFVADLPGEPTRVQCVMGSSGETTPCPEASVDGTTVQQSIPALAPWTTATVLIEVPAEVFDVTFPTFDVEELDTLGEAAQPDDEPPLPEVPAALLLLLLVAAPALLLEALRARLVYRDRVTDPALHDRVAPTAELEPPDNARPLETAALLQRSVGNEVVLATVLDLELRGIVQTATTETAEGKPRITVTPAPAGALRGEPARPWEASFLQLLLGSEGKIEFDGTYDAETTKRASAAGAALESHGGWLLGRDSPLTHSGAGWLRGGAFAAWIALCLLLGAVIGGAGAGLLQLSIVVAIVIWVCLGVSWIVLSFVWRPQRLPLTSEGRDVIARTRAFREFLEQVHADRLEFAAGREHYDQHHPALSLLPYAMALGLAESWYLRFEPVLTELAQQGAVPTSGAYPWWAYGAGYSAVRTSYSSSTTSPSSSGSGGSFGGGGAGSGGGGGGGGSW
ncbi:MAG TPA: DUF2207 domain-containing protein [Egicoccus sp.]|nr:DUF2207 domain-containing protein [Egicoccus sp.]HSK23233.1 DUF2207 domain-containing protein [Egicoccus sp.]